MSPSPLRIPKGPVAIGWMVFSAWQKLPPAQRRQVLDAARVYGPRVAAAAAAAAATRATGKKKNAES